MALLEQIRNAEREAEAIRTDAQRQAREILKATEGACLQAERGAAVDHRALYQQQLQQARTRTEAVLKAEAEKQAGAREALCAEAAQRVPKAAELIFRRITAERS